MQPNDKSGKAADGAGSGAGSRAGGLSLLLIAIFSGLVVKVVGDPLVEVISPPIKHAAKDAGDFLEDQRWGRQWNRQWRQWEEQWSKQWEDWRRSPDAE